MNGYKDEWITNDELNIFNAFKLTSLNGWKDA